MDAASFLLLILLTTVVALVTAVSFSVHIGRKETEPSGATELAERMRKEGAVFLRKKDAATVICVIAFSCFLFFLFDRGGQPFITASFLFGALLAASTGHVGMHAAAAANVRVATILKTHPAKAFRLAFVSGAEMGLTVTGLSLLGIALTLYILSVIFGETWETALRMLLGLSAGISSVALFARVGGGMIDFLESHALAVIAAMTLGWATVGTESAIFFPLMIAAFGILTSVIASAFVRTRKHTKAAKALRRGILVNTALLLPATFILARRFFPAAMAWEVSVACIAGLLAGLLLRFLMGRIPSSRTVGTSVLLLILAIAVAHTSAGLYGIALAAVGMLSILGTALAADASVPVLLNASLIASAGDRGGAAQKHAAELTQGSDARSVAARGYACAASLFATLALVFAFTNAALIPSIDLTKPVSLTGLLLGGVLPFLFSAMIVRAGEHAAHTMTEACRRQRNNLTRALSLSATTALLETVAPAILAIGAPLLVGGALGSPALAGLLIGSIVTGMPLSISMLSRPSCDLGVEGLLKLMAVVSLLAIGFFAA